jgi:hypothetical protein
VANKFCTVAPNICGTSVWNLFHVTLWRLELRWLPVFQKHVHPWTIDLYSQTLVRGEEYPVPTEEEIRWSHSPTGRFGEGNTGCWQRNRDFCTFRIADYVTLSFYYKTLLLMLTSAVLGAVNYNIIHVHRPPAASKNLDITHVRIYVCL